MWKGLSSKSEVERMLYIVYCVHVFLTLEMKSTKVQTLGTI